MWFIGLFLRRKRTKRMRADEERKAEGFLIMLTINDFKRRDGGFFTFIYSLRGDMYSSGVIFPSDGQGTLRKISEAVVHHPA